MTFESHPHHARRLLTAMFLLLGTTGPVAYADVFVVNSLAADDDGTCAPAPDDCSLREAVSAANSRMGPDTVSFADLPGTAPWRIALSGSGVNIMDDDTDIDGWTAPGWIDRPLVEIVGVAVDVRNADNALIRGLVLSGSLTPAITISMSTGSMIAGNYIGTDVTGTRSFATGAGISVLAANQVVIGTNGDDVDDALEGNVIASGTSTGISLNGSRNADYLDNVIAGNLIGTDASGGMAFGNNTGILINVNSYKNTQIGTDGDGTSDELERNVISGNAGNGIWDLGTDTTIQGNLIGTNASGCSGLGNAQSGIRAGPSTLIGGEAAGLGNTISSNGQYGVSVSGNVMSTIRGNEIFRNDQIGIDISVGAVGPTPNDPGDSDSGPNGAQNYPDLTAAATIGNEIEISGTLDSAPGATYRVDIFASAMCRQGLFGEAERYLGVFDVTTGGNGLIDFTERVAGIDPTVTPFISATATDTLGNTSEISYCVSLEDLTFFRDDFEAACRLPWNR